jgi:hypothetical protein
MFLHHRAPRIQGRLRSPHQSRHHLLRHQPQRRIRLRRRNRLCHRIHPVAKRNAQHQSRRSASRHALQLSLRQPFVYTVAIAPPYFSNGPHIGPAAISRNNFTPITQDTWKVTPTLHPRLRPFAGSSTRPSPSAPTAPAGFSDVNGTQEYVVNPQPGYQDRLERLGSAHSGLVASYKQVLGARRRSITTIPPNIWQDNFLTGSTPFAVYPRLLSAPPRPFITDSRSRPRSCPTPIRRRA